MLELPDPQWYLDHVLVHAGPGDPATPPTAGPARWQAWWRSHVTDVEPLASAARQGFVLTTAQLANQDVSRSTARHAVRTGRWSVPARGTVAVLDVGDDGDRFVVARRRHAVAAAATTLRRPDHAASARTAAILHGLPTLAVPRQPEVTLAGSVGSGRRRAAHVFEAQLEASRVESWFGVPVTSVARTLVDLGRHDARDAIMAVDAALRGGLVTSAEIDDCLRGARGWPGVVRAREVLALASPLAESPLESLVRLVLHDDGFPPPVLQVDIAGYRVDCCWPDRRVVLEADGRVKYSADELWREKRREQVLRSLGWRVERVLWSDVTRDWPRAAGRLRSLLASPPTASRSVWSL